MVIFYKPTSQEGGRIYACVFEVAHKKSSLPQITRYIYIFLYELKLELTYIVRNTVILITFSNQKFSRIELLLQNLSP